MKLNFNLPSWPADPGATYLPRTLALGLRPPTERKPNVWESKLGKSQLHNTMIDLEYRGVVAVLKLDHGKVNAIDLELLEALERCLAEIEVSAASAVVLTGSGGNYSAGVNLHRVLEGGADYARRLIPALSDAFIRLFGYPLPVVAAVNGNAIAGGCLLACCCDHRIMVESNAVIGMPVLPLGAPVPAASIEILRFGLSNSRLQQIIYSGKTYRAAEASEWGLIDQVVAHDRLLEHADGHAERLGEIPRETFRVTKRQLREPVVQRMSSLGNQSDEAVIRVWSDPQFHARLRDHLARS